MGHLGGGNTKDIKAGAKVAIPIWLAYVLIYSCVARTSLECAR